MRQRINSNLRAKSKTPKKLIVTMLSLLTLCSLSSSPAVASSNITLYGFLKTDIQHARLSGNGRTATINRAVDDLSSFGLRGVEKISGDLDVFFQIESNVGLMGTGKSQIGDRNTGLGMRGSWGEFRMGHWESPYRLTTAYMIDPFPASVMASNSIMGNGMRTAGDGEEPQSFDRRQKQQIFYGTPTWNGITFRIAATSNDSGKSGTPHALSGSLTYLKNNWYFAWGHEYHRNYFYKGSTDYANKIAIFRRFGNTKIGGSYENIRYQPASGKKLRRDSFQIALTHDIDKHQLRASYVQALNSKGNYSARIGGAGPAGSSSGAKQFSLGYGYDLSKRTEFWTGYTRLKNGKHAMYNLSTNFIPGIMPGDTASALAIGLTHKF